MSVASFNLCLPCLRLLRQLIVPHQKLQRSAGLAVCGSAAHVLPRQGVTLWHLACRYAGAQLERLVALSVGNVSEAYLHNLQTELEKCDRLGSSNRDLPADEDVSTFSEIIGSAENAADVSEMVEQLAAA